MSGVLNKNVKDLDKLFFSLSSQKITRRSCWRFMSGSCRRCRSTTRHINRSLTLWSSVTSCGMRCWSLRCVVLLFFFSFWVQSSYHLWKDRDGDLLLLKVNHSTEVFETMNFDFFCETEKPIIPWLFNLFDSLIVRLILYYNLVMAVCSEGCVHHMWIKH